MYMGFFDIGQGGTQTLYETSKWYTSRKSLGIADLGSADANLGEVIKKFSCIRYKRASRF